MRPIDADAFRTDLMTAIEVPVLNMMRPSSWAEAYESCVRALDNAPTLDHEPVKHANWIRQDDTYTRFQCGECKSKNFDRRWVFCPLCGAKMDGGKEDA